MTNGKVWAVVELVDGEVFNVALFPSEETAAAARRRILRETDHGSEVHVACCDLPKAEATPPRSFEEQNVYERAAQIARTFNVRVAIVHNGNDGPGRVWETIAEAKRGGFPSADGYQIHDIVTPELWLAAETEFGIALASLGYAEYCVAQHDRAVRSWGGSKRCDEDRVKLVTRRDNLQALAIGWASRD